MEAYSKSKLNRVKRGKIRATYDVEKINTILDAGFIGYVSYVYKKAIDHTLPAGSKNQFSSGGGLLVNYDQLKPGDLMFFSHNGRSIQHVGIFIDNNHFIHAPRTGRRISIDEVGRYWKQKFIKGRSIVE